MPDFFNKVIKPFVQRNGWTKNEQAQHYKRQYKTFAKQGDKFGRQMVPSSTEMEDVSSVSAADFQQQAGALNTFIYRTEPNKMAKLQTWREMAMFPEISFALGEMEDEAINFDAESEFIELIIKNDRLSQNENIRRNLVAEWKYIMYDIMQGHKNIYEWFMEFLIDGEIFFEKVVDPITAKERGIVRVKRLRPEYSHPIWEEIESDSVYEFIHKTPQNIIRMPPEMVAYANSGIYAYPDRFSKEVLSFLEVAKQHYRKLRQMEDALVIYRLVRAPERRVFKIEVGKLPKQKAESYVQSLMKKYRQRKIYDPNTGEVNHNLDAQAMIEDFWLPSQDGKGSSIDTLPGGENLGQIDDVLFFLDKLYRALRIPMSRVKSDTGFSLGDTSDITREEVRFHKMVNKFVQRFSDVFLQIYISHLRLKGYADEYGITEKDFRVKLLSNNLFEEFLETDILSKRSENFERFIGYAEGDESNPPLFSKKWLMKRFLKLENEDILENDSFLKKEEQERKTKGIELGGEGGESGSLSDLGGEGGGKEKGGGGGGLGDLGDLGDLGGESGGTDKEKKDNEKEPQSIDDLPDVPPKKEKGGPEEKDLESFA